MLGLGFFLSLGKARNAACVTIFIKGNLSDTSSLEWRTLTGSRLLYLALLYVLMWGSSFMYNEAQFVWVFFTMNHLRQTLIERKLSSE